ncbi:hypothetical protein KAW38_02280 [Candidatus Micrarchaeota archaeon]|nr:hypothetical protein [Candidatus Micrarchaeota archaeon]
MDETGFKLERRLAEKTDEETLIHVIKGQLTGWDWRVTDSGAEHLKYSQKKVKKGVLNLLIKDLFDVNGEVRERAAGALGDIAEKEIDISIAVPALVKALRDEVEQVRDDSSRALVNTVSGYKTKKELLQFLRKIRGSAEAKQLSKKIYKKWMKKENEKTGELQKIEMRKPQKLSSKNKIRKVLN